jgi:hypothetical protein
VENKHNYCQGFLKLNNKVRPKTLAKHLNAQFRGIEISGAVDQVACKAYCQLKLVLTVLSITPPEYDGSDVIDLIEKQPYPWQKTLWTKTKKTRRPEDLVNLVNLWRQPKK